jgi:hypothetical protein
MFVHAQVFASRGDQPIIATTDDLKATNAQYELPPGLLELDMKRLLQVDVKELSFIEFLCDFHQLVAVILALLLQRLFHGQEHMAQLQQAEELFIMWTRHFYSDIPETLDSSLDPWHAWSIAETCRRTIFAIVELQGCLEYVRYGYVNYRPFVESLPFDARTGVWEANTQEEWKIAIRRHGGQETSLMSWYEFIESGGPTARKEHDGMLQRLLLSAHFGKETGLSTTQLVPG